MDYSVFTIENLAITRKDWNEKSKSKFILAIIDNTHAIHLFVHGCDSMADHGTINIKGFVYVTNGHPDHPKTLRYFRGTDTQKTPDVTITQLYKPADKDGVKMNDLFSTIASMLNSEEDHFIENE